MSDKTNKAATNTESQPAVRASEGSFSREQFLSSAKYSFQDKDVLAALLEPEKLYTASEAQHVIDDFKNKEAE
ncbi:hypothetical protein MHH60_29880 [Paenibacillus sp. FSL H7-0716]|uniref:Uncharacterized protein n=1 Tax=Paenibacillus odorifer TaxID=189426 RepID=A0AB36J7H9_9BACL|nr:hypothetical protein [Paenibacillus odorifer]OME11080.1 hypothetical protein BSK47_29680 [Paenibacillus odorifer]